MTGRCQSPEALDGDLGGRTRSSCLVLVGRVQVHHRFEIRVEPRQNGVGEQLLRRRSGAGGSARTTSPGGARRPKRGPRSDRPAPFGRRLRAAVGSPAPSAARHRCRPPQTRASTRLTNAGCRNGMSVEQTNAAGARSATAASPVAMPRIGPSPSTGSSTTCTPIGNSGSCWPGAATTTTGPSIGSSEERGGAVQQRGAVPLERCLRRAHSRRSATGQHHSRGTLRRCDAHRRSYRLMSPVISGLSAERSP